ncbi:MAG: transporter permease [Candidatus Nomurabacteria bacterium]|nr:transporter permease [Candidatus Nomurabacteria bacterium]
MNPRQKYIAFRTIFDKEIRRSFRTWKQTFLPSIITTVMYFLIFGTFIGSQIKAVGGVSYMAFIVPGLMMMAVLMNSFQSMLTKFFFLKFQKTVQEILITPMPAWLVVTSYLASSMFNGVIIGFLIFISSFFFETIHIVHPIYAVLVILLTSMFFALLGLINATYAKTFDDMGIVSTFFLMPLTYLGGIFYSVKMLPGIWQTISHFNPILYMINALRYGILGFSDISFIYCIAVILGAIAIAFAWILYLFKTGRGLKA